MPVHVLLAMYCLPMDMRLLHTGRAGWIARGRLPSTKGWTDVDDPSIILPQPAHVRLHLTADGDCSDSWMMLLSNVISPTGFCTCDQDLMQPVQAKRDCSQADNI